MSKFYMIGEDIKKLIVEDQDKYLVISWIIFNTNYQAEYKDLKQFECYLTINGLMDKLNLSRTKVQRILKELLNDNLIEYSFKSNTKNKPSIIKANFISNNPIYHYDNNTNDNTNNNTNGNTNEPVENTKTEVVDKTNNNTNNNTDNNTLSKYNNLNKNLNDLSKFVVNSDQLELIQEKCNITDTIGEQQQKQIKELDINLLKQVIDKCNRIKSSYSINYLLKVYSNTYIEGQIKEDPKTDNGKVIHTKKKYDPIENPHYKKYSDLEERLLKLQTKKRKTS